MALFRFGNIRWRPGIGLPSAIFLLFFAVSGMSQSSEAARPTHKQLMAVCKAKYGKNVVSVTISKNGTITCHTQVTRQMTRAEVFEACRKKYGATTIIVVKKKSGWLCRYYGRY